MAFHRRSSHSFFSVVAVRVTIARKGGKEDATMLHIPPSFPSTPSDSFDSRLFVLFGGRILSRKKKKRGEIDRFEWSKLGKLLDCSIIFANECSNLRDRRKEKRREELLILGADRVSYAWGRVTHSGGGGGASDERRLREEARFVEV